MDSPQIICDSEGKPAFAVIPIAEYEALLERADEGVAQRVYDAFETTKPETFPDALAERLIAGEHPIRVFRDYRGLSQGELAAMAGTTQVTISQIETGARTGSFEMLKLISAALKIEIDESWFRLER